MNDEVLALVVRMVDEASASARRIAAGIGGITERATGAHGPLGLLGRGLGSLGGMARGALGAVTSLQGMLLGGGAIMALKGAADAAAADAASTARLTTAIAANVAGGRDYTASLEATIAAGQRLAFTDDDTRASMARLVTSTHDVAEATRLNAVAMDLARLKGMSLEDAANLVGKVHDGNVGILTRYGISVAAGSSATSALAQVQAAAAGQATAFADSAAGGAARMEDQFSELAESVGALVLPAMQAAMSLVSETVVPAIERGVGAVGGWIAANSGLVDGVSGFVAGAGAQLAALVSERVLPALADLAPRLAEVGRVVVEQVVPVVAAMAERFASFVALVAERVVPVVLDLARRVWEGGLNRVLGAAGKLVGSVIDVLGQLVDWITANEAVMDALRAAADLVGAAFGTAADLVGSVIDVLGEAAGWIRGNTPVFDVLGAAVNGLAMGFRLAVEFIRSAISALGDLGRWVSANLDVVALLAGNHALGVAGPSAPSRPPGRAAGGPVAAGSPYIVGERGPELFVPSRSGTVVPGGGAPVTLAAGSIVVNGARDPAATAREIVLHVKRELGRQGVSFSGGY